MREKSLKENYTEDDYKSCIFNVKPGITGYAQVIGRSNLKVQDARKWELKYAEDISFLTDIKILLKTVAVVLKMSGTN